MLTTTLIAAENRTGYYGVYLNKPGQPKPYLARVQRGGKEVCLGSYATAEEAALCVARSPDGQAIAAKRAAALPPLTSEEARQQAQAEKLTLRVAKSKTGYFSVSLTKPGQPKPYQARVWNGGKQVRLGYFATAEEAALCVARSPEGKVAAANSLMSQQARQQERQQARQRGQQARQQARAEGLTLVVAENTTGYFGVSLPYPGLPKPYQARVRRSGKDVALGSFATAEEAALCVARSPERRAVAAERAASAVPLTSEEARQQAQAEKLTLIAAENRTGYYGVYLNKPGQPKPYLARVQHGGKNVCLGTFATAEEAALCLARSPEGQAIAAERAAAPQPLTSEETRQQAQAEKLTLRVAKSKTGYYGVSLTKPSQPKPYQARVSLGGKTAHLGYFATAKEAALCVARSPEGQLSVKRTASRAPLKKKAKGNPPAMPSGASVNEEEVVPPPMPPGANRWNGLVLLEERARRACFLLACAERHETELPKRQRMQ